MKIAKTLNLFLFSGWEWEEMSDNNDKGCETGDFDDTESFYADSEYAKDTPKQTPKALRNHPPGGRLAPTPDDFQVSRNIYLIYDISIISLCTNQ